jgi:hypothetical protein
MKTFLTTNLIALAITLSANAATVAYYEFDGTGTAAVSDTILDLSGNGRDGAVTGGSLIYGSDLTFGLSSPVSSYLTFEADSPTSDRVVVPGNAAFTFGASGSYTIEAVFRTTQTAIGVIIADNATTSTTPQWWLRHDGAGQMFGLARGNANEGNATTGSPAVNNGQWHVASMVYTGTALNLYIDGALRSSDATITSVGTIGGASGTLMFGEINSLTANRSFAGDIAAVRLSDTALTTVDFLVVPEPGTLSLLAVGVVSLFTIRRRSCR